VFILAINVKKRVKLTIMYALWPNTIFFSYKNNENSANNVFVDFLDKVENLNECNANPIHVKVEVTDDEK
jgi:hypothetical protein